MNSHARGLSAPAHTACKVSRPARPRAPAASPVVVAPPRHRGKITPRSTNHARRTARFYASATARPGRTIFRSPIAEDIVNGRKVAHAVLPAAPREKEWDAPRKLLGRTEDSCAGASAVYRLVLLARPSGGRKPASEARTEPRPVERHVARHRRTRRCAIPEIAGTHRSGAAVSRRRPRLAHGWSTRRAPMAARETT